MRRHEVMNMRTDSGASELGYRPLDLAWAIHTYSKLRFFGHFLTPSSRNYEMVTQDSDPLSPCLPLLRQCKV